MNKVIDKLEARLAARKIANNRTAKADEAKVQTKPSKLKVGGAGVNCLIK